MGITLMRHGRSRAGDEVAHEGRCPLCSGVTFAFGDAGFVRTSYDGGRHVWVVGQMGGGATGLGLPIV